jgi:hypothetical protein
MSVEIDVYANVDIETWNDHKETILGFSVDGRNYHDNECRMTHDDDYNVNIRIDEDDLEALSQFTNFIETKEVEHEQ